MKNKRCYLITYLACRTTIISAEVEAVAAGESGSDHGRPLLQSTSGAYNQLDQKYLKT